MEEILNLLRENNKMLKRICSHLDIIESIEYQNKLDIKDLAINIIADLYVDGLEPNNQIRQIVNGIR